MSWLASLFAFYVQRWPNHLLRGVGKNELFQLRWSSFPTPLLLILHNVTNYCPGTPLVNREGVSIRKALAKFHRFIDWRRSVVYQSLLFHKFPRRRMFFSTKVKAQQSSQFSNVGPIYLVWLIFWLIDTRHEIHEKGRKIGTSVFC